MIYQAHKILNFQNLNNLFYRKIKLFKFFILHFLFSINSIYFCFFYCCLIGFGVLLNIKKYWLFPKKIFLPILSIGILIFFVAINFLPNVLYMGEHGKNTQAVERNNSEAEYYALKPANIILPGEFHNIRIFQELKRKYVPTSRPEGFNEYIGLVGVFGLILTTYFSLSKKPINLIKKYFVYLVILFSVGIVGGLGALITNYLVPQFRCYNRVSIFIATISIFCFFIFYDRWLKNKSTKFKTAVYLFSFLFFTVDSLPRDMKINPESGLQFEKDQQFFDAVDSNIPSDSKILQLPYIPFPESPVLFGMEDYDHFKAFLASKKNFKFSYGAIKGRSGAEWIQKVSDWPLNKNAILETGYNFILVNLDGYDPNIRIKRLKDIISVFGSPIKTGGFGERWHLFEVK